MIFSNLRENVQPLFAESFFSSHLWRGTEYVIFLNFNSFNSGLLYSWKIRQSVFPESCVHFFKEKPSKILVIASKFTHDRAYRFPFCLFYCLFKRLNKKWSIHKKGNSFSRITEFFPTIFEEFHIFMWQSLKNWSFCSAKSGWTFSIRLERFP